VVTNSEENLRNKSAMVKKAILVIINTIPRRFAEIFDALLAIIMLDY
jgi:hypothetical protein